MDDYLTEIYADLEERITDICAIGDINEDLVKIAVSNLSTLRADIIATGRNQGILQKIDRQLDTYSDVARIPQLTSKFPIIREQMVVLIIGALEVFIADIYRSIANNNPEYFSWSDAKERITFEPALLKEGFTLGDVLLGHLKNKGYNFQDLQSLIRSLNFYCGITLDLSDEQRDAMIFGAAARHIIVHNRSKINGSFLKQIEMTSFGNSNLEKGTPLAIDDKFVEDLSETIRSFCGYIVTSLLQRDD